jgi:hypothetical protein
MRSACLNLVALFCLLGSTCLFAAPFKPGNIVVSNSPFGDEDLFEYTPAGALVQSINVSPANDGRDLIVDRAGRVQLYNGTFSPTLTQYDPLTNAFNSRTFAGWSTVNNLTYGGVATNGRYVFATDMNTNGGEASGVVRFDLDGGATTRFATSTEPIDLNVGQDGLLYTLSRGNAFNGGGTQVDVYNPATMAFVRTVTLPEEHRAIAVAANGHIFTAQRDTVSRVNHYDPNGVRLDFIDDPGVGGFGDIDLNNAGGLVIASHGGVLLITDTNLDSIRFFQTRSSNGTNFATWVPEPTLMAPLLALAFLATRIRPLRK